MSKSAAFFLVFSKSRRGYSPLNVRVTTRTPRLEPGEVPLAVRVELPDALFDKPTLRATIKVDQEKLPPALITAEVADNIAQQLRQSLGVEVKLTVEAPSTS